jgi:hypothetical protein
VTARAFLWSVGLCYLSLAAKSLYLPSAVRRRLFFLCSLLAASVGSYIISQWRPLSTVRVYIGTELTDGRTATITH